MRVSFNKIDAALDDIENYASYYIGGSLCIDFKYHPSVVLNRNGRGFAYYGSPNFEKFDEFKKDMKSERRFVVPRRMQDKIEAIYQEYKVKRRKK